MTNTDTYTELEIQIRVSDQDSELYVLDAEVNDGSHYGPWQYRLTPEMGRTLLMADTDPKEFGLRLFYDLGAGPIGRAYDRAVGRADAQTDGRLRVRLNLDNQRAFLNAIPWEKLYHVYRELEIPLAATEKTPFSRYTNLEIPEPEPVLERPLKMLVMIANPLDLKKEYDLDAIPVAEEIGHLVDALRDPQSTGQVTVQLLTGRTPLKAETRQMVNQAGWQILPGPASLSNLLLHLNGCHVLHILAHGHFNKTTRKAALYLEGDDGKTDPTPDQEIVDRLAPTGMPRLIFLAACESASRTFAPGSLDANAFVGLAPRLVQAGAAAVVAMQDKVSMSMARTLSTEFYRKLFQHGRVDLALNQARLQVMAAAGSEWAASVLFTRLKQGQLFGSNPIQAILQGVHRRGRQFYPPYPVEVCHLVGHQAIGNLERLPENNLPTRNLLETVEAICTEHVNGISASQEASLRRAKVILMLGWRGSGRTTQLWNIARYTARLSLEERRQGSLIVPIFVDFAGFSHSAAGARHHLKRMILHSLRQDWPQMEEETLDQWLQGHSGCTVRLLLDDSGELLAPERRALWRSMLNLAHIYPNLQVVVSLDRQNFDMQLLPENTDLLIIQPMSESKIRRFLTEPDAPPHFRHLLSALEERQLFDLAASPWLFHTLITQAEQGILPSSRADVLGNFMTEALDRVAPRHSGIRIWAEQTLYQLAWRIQSSRQRMWREQDVFETMASVRRYREYQLDDLYEKLLQSGLLAQEEGEQVRFTYRGIQAYCCAQAIDRMPMEAQEEIIDDITASLGRLTRYRWWEITLILLSRLMDNPDRLVRAIDFGIDLTEGEQVFLLARILLENPTQRISLELRNQVISTLIWRVNAQQEPRPERRARAAQLLGQLLSNTDDTFRERAGIPALVHAAFGKTRPALTTETTDEPLTYDYSPVRLQAAMALKTLLPLERERIQTEINTLAESQNQQQFFAILSQWHAAITKALAGGSEAAVQGSPLLAEVDYLGAYLSPTDQTDAGTLAVAAFALGNIAATTPGDEQSNAAQDLLFSAFQNDQIQEQMRWAITDALTLLEYTDVRQAIIDPVLAQKAPTWAGPVAYLIGATRTQDEASLAFLHNCLKESPSLHLKILAMDALANLYDRSCLEQISALAKGNFDGIPLPPKITSEERNRLRSHAIAALGNIGDRKVVAELQAQRQNWSIELERALFLASEEIDWRLEFSPMR